MKKQILCAAALSLFAIFGAFAQTAPKTTEYNFTGCGTSVLIAEHGSLSADGTKLSFPYYRHGAVVEKNEGDNLVTFEGQTSDVLKNGERKFDGVGFLPGSGGPKISATAHGKIYKNRFALLVYRGDDLLYALYGYVGPVDDLVKLDQEEAEFVCQMARMVGAENVPEILNQWLHQDDAAEKNEKKS